MTNLVEVAVVPVAGLGTRMLPLTRSIPKEMLPVGQKLCIEHIVDELLDCGIKEIIFVVSPGKEKIVEHFAVNESLDLRLRAIGKKQIADRLKQDTVSSRIKIASVNQAEQKGLGHAILCAKEQVGDRPFAIALGDSIIDTRGESRVLDRMCNAFADGTAGVLVAFQEVAREHVVKYGIAHPAATDQVRPGNVFDLAGLVEKPAIEDAPSNFAISARYVLSPTIFQYLEETKPGTGGEIQLTDAMSAMIASGIFAKGVCLGENEKRIDVGSIKGYMEAFVEFAMNDSDFGDDIQKRFASHRQ